MDRSSRAAERISGYAASVDAQCRVLVLGSMPSIRSLELVEYYGHAQNRFWDFIEELFAIPRALEHVERLRRLRAAGVGLWDVVQSCQRETSADAKIQAVQVNDFVALFQSYPGLARVYCNGAKAYELWQRHVVSQLEAAATPVPNCERLPSTSPANASQTRAAKLAAWRRLVATLRAEPGV